LSASTLDGCVNTAVYDRPHVIDEQTMVWGMTEGRTYRNFIENPQASFMFNGTFYTQLLRRERKQK